VKPEQIVRVLLEVEEEPFDARDYFLAPNWHEVWQVNPDEIRQFLREPDPQTQEVYRVVSMYWRKLGSLALRVRGAHEQRYGNYGDSVRLQQRLQSYLDDKFHVGGRGSPFMVNVWHGRWTTDLDVDIIKSEPDGHR